MTVDQINQELLKLVVNERNGTKEILQYIAELYTCKGHVKLGYSSIMRYLTKGLGYSDDQAYRRWTGAKLLIHLPEAADKIASGLLNLSQVAQAQKAFETAAKEQEQALSKEKKQDVLESLENKNNFDSQQILCEQLNLKAQERDRIRPQSNKTVVLTIVMTEVQHEKFKQVKSLLSHRLPDQKNADVLELIFDSFLEKKQGQGWRQKQNSSTVIGKTLVTPTKTNSNINKDTSKDSNSNSEAKKDSKSETNRDTDRSKDPTPQSFMVPMNQRAIKKAKKSRYIPAEIRRIVFAKAKGKCEYIHPATGLRCESTYQLEYEHIRPMGLGGKTELSNLRMCCHSCNIYAAGIMGIGFETTSYFRH